jgi:hypothetical protein
LDEMYHPFALQYQEALLTDSDTYCHASFQ